MSTKAVYFIETEKPLGREDIEKLFAKMGPRDPIPRALRQILLERVAAATVDVTAEKLTEREAGIAAGRLSELLAVVEQLTSLVSTQPR